MKPTTGLFFLLLWLSATAQTEALPINRIQVIGSHNSYKQAIDPALFSLLSKSDSASLSRIDYSHAGLSEQLNLGLRNLEIDVYADPKGGKFAHPKGLELARNQQPYPDLMAVMEQPGFKVLHVPDIDFRSNCQTFVLCLSELKNWSSAHKDHEPVFITINAKDDSVRKPGFIVPEKFTASLFEALEKELVGALGRENLITPDDIRGDYKTLEDAVLHGNWPTVKEARGRFIFILDETGDKLTQYIKGHPSLEGRLLFANASPGTPEAAILIRNNPREDNIALLVKKGYIIRTRADADTREARADDYSTFEAACKSGAQIITTDYYKKSSHFASNYIIRFQNGSYLRKNPLY